MCDVMRRFSRGVCLFIVYLSPGEGEEAEREEMEDCVVVGF